MAPLCKSQTKKGQQALNADHIFESPYSSPCFFFLTSPPPSLSSLVLGNIKQNSFLHTHKIFPNCVEGTRNREGKNCEGRGGAGEGGGGGGGGEKKCPQTSCFSGLGAVMYILGARTEFKLVLRFFLNSFDGSSSKIIKSNGQIA